MFLVGAFMALFSIAACVLIGPPGRIGTFRMQVAGCLAGQPLAAGCKPCARPSGELSRGSSFHPR